jgi:hypothetical protein
MKPLVIRRSGLRMEEEGFAKEEGQLLGIGSGFDRFLGAGA